MSPLLITEFAVLTNRVIIESTEKQHRQFVTGHQLARLVSWCPELEEEWTQVYQGPLPWDTVGDV
jgi:hypothetical protein